MPKLHLKRTPEEEAARRVRKLEKREAKRRRRHDHYGYGSSSSKRQQRTAVVEEDNSCNEEDGEEFIGPVPGPSSYQPDYETIRAEIEEQRFREKMAMAFDDDERLDSIEARFNSFAHVPMHWGGKNSSKPRINYDNDEFLAVDPMTMDDEEYAEWVRMGMYRKTHAQEIAEKERMKAERAAKRAQEKAIRAETERLQKVAAAERWSHKLKKENKRLELLRLEYQNRWKLLLSNTQPADIVDIGFNDIPWPILLAYKHKSDKKSVSDTVSSLSLDDFTPDAISTFLLSEAETENPKKGRKEKLRETLLRFHPDKFEGRLMSRVRPEEKEKVTQALGIVVRVLNDLMGEG
ncbi:hypothetical protein GG344DRAFT_52056 [Lentinula edodes]|nr:hypothetical protein GG344DRAFT_52056 [Lentinula edodes]